ncbi:MAG: SUMF1/EgtB/PvdO family nonheme iron enzyme [Candidatus Glassbacteria bacterium]
MSELLADNRYTGPVRLIRAAFFLSLAALFACDTNLPIAPEKSEFSETGLKFSLQSVNFDPTFIGRTDSQKIDIEYGDTLDMVLLVSVSDTLYFAVFPDSFFFTKRNKKFAATVTYTPEVPGEANLGYLRLITHGWADSARTIPDTIGADSLRLAGVGQGAYLDLEMMFIPGGSFSMGLDSAAAAASVDTRDQWGVHEVTLSSFFIGRYEVTNLQYYEFWTEVKPGHTPEDTVDIGVWPNVALEKPNFPVVGMSWEDAMAYCQWLSLRTGEHYALPTEAQWEYVATGGEGREYPWSQAGLDSSAVSDSVNPGPYANVKLGKDGYTFTAPVNSFPAGAGKFGTLNMAGNVWEWCLDWYDPDYYRSESDTWVDPQGSLNPEHRLFRVVRGGSCLEDLGQARCANRAALSPGNREVNTGFRVARLP